MNEAFVVIVNGCQQLSMQKHFLSTTVRVRKANLVVYKCRMSRK